MARSTRARSTRARSTRARGARAHGHAGHAGRAPTQRVDLVYALTHLSLETWTLLAILAGALLLRILPLGAFSTEFDEGVYWLSLRAMAEGHALYSSIYYAQPPFFLLSVYPWFLLFGQTMPATRFVVALYSLVGIVATYFIGKGLGGRYVGLAAAALLAVDPLYLLLSRTLDAEGPSLAFMLAGIALAMHAARSEERAERMRRALVVASGALLGLALMAKLLAIVGVVPAAIVLAWPELLLTRRSTPGRSKPGARHATRSRWQPLQLPRRDVWTDLGWLVGSMIGASLLVLAPFVGSAGALYQQVVGLHLDAARVLGRGPLANFGMIAQTGGEYWLFAAALAAVAVALWRRALVVIPVAAWALSTLIVLVAQQPLFAHHVVFLVPPLAVLAALLVRIAPPLPAARGRRRPLSTARLRAALRQPTLVTYGALILLGATFVVGLIIAAVENERVIEYQPGQAVLISWTLAGAVPPGDVVVTDNPYLAGLVGLREPPELIDTSFVRIETGALTARQLEDIITRDDVRAVLFESGRFDRVPGFRDWVKRNFQVGKDFGAGRVLYIAGAHVPVPV